MSHFQHHIFFCLNERDADSGRASCGGEQAKQMQKYAKAQLKNLGLSGAGKARVNQAGCLDRCEQGPCMVVYPSGRWYTYFDESDIDEIIKSDIQNNQAVTRLLIDKA